MSNEDLKARTNALEGIQNLIIDVNLNLVDNLAMDTLHIDGYNMIWYLLQDCYLNVFNGGGSPLHLIYALETFLSQITNTEVKVKVVFYDNLYIFDSYSPREAEGCFPETEPFVHANNLLKSFDSHPELLAFYINLVKSHLGKLKNIEVFECDYDPLNNIPMDGDSKEISLETESDTEKNSALQKYISLFENSSAVYFVHGRGSFGLFLFKAFIVLCSELNTAQDLTYQKNIVYGYSANYSKKFKVSNMLKSYISAEHKYLKSRGFTNSLKKSIHSLQKFEANSGEDVDSFNKLFSEILSASKTDEHFREDLEKANKIKEGMEIEERALVFDKSVQFEDVYKNLELVVKNINPRLAELSNLSHSSLIDLFDVRMIKALILIRHDSYKDNLPSTTSIEFEQMVRYGGANNELISYINSSFSSKENKDITKEETEISNGKKVEDNEEGGEDDEDDEDFDWEDELEKEEQEEEEQEKKKKLEKLERSKKIKEQMQREEIEREEQEALQNGYEYTNEFNNIYQFHSNEKLLRKYNRTYKTLQKIASTSNDERKLVLEKASQNSLNIKGESTQKLKTDIMEIGKGYNGDYDSELSKLRVADLKDILKKCSKDLNALYSRVYSRKTIAKDIKKMIFDYVGAILHKTIIVQKKIFSIYYGEDKDITWRVLCSICKVYGLIKYVEDDKEYLRKHVEQAKAKKFWIEHKNEYKIILDELAARLYFGGYVDDCNLLLKYIGKKELDKKSDSNKTSVHMQLYNNFTFPSLDEFKFIDLEKDLAQKIKFEKELSFKPDPWQVNVIQAIEERKNVIACAPTSSGKTFISYYAIEKVLKEDSTPSYLPTVVICVPTKALMNQIYVDLCAKFEKKYKFEQNRMIGMFNSSIGCPIPNTQILITLPVCLEILLLSPTHAKWRQNLRYIILDEIHEIRSDSGSYLEHTLSMTTCPYMALSATVGNPDEFKNWLKNYKTIKKGDTHFEHHRKRLIPLEYYFFQQPTPKNPEQVKEISDEAQSNEEFEKAIVGDLKQIHPLGVLDVDNINEKMIENIPVMSAQQCIDLFYTSEKYLKTDETNPIFSEELALTKYFEKLSLFERPKVVHYSEEIVDRIKSLIRRNNPKEMDILKKIILFYRTNIDKAYQETYRVVDKRSLSKTSSIYKNIFQLVVTLKNQKKLPTIFFMFDMEHINKMLKIIVYTLEKVNANKEFYLWESISKKNKAIPEILKAIEKVSNEEDIEDIHLLGLLHGIGFHYRSANETYKIEVENLFKNGHLPVILATSTLSQGINLPAKSCVMVQESRYLSTGIFKQCAGRSGRRGYDNLGNVIIYGIRQPILMKYLSSASEPVVGSSPISIQFVARTLSLYDGVHRFPTSDTDFFRNHGYLKNEMISDREPIKRICMELFNNPLVSMIEKDKEKSKLMQKFLFKFAVDFLVDGEMLSPNGIPLAWSSFLVKGHYISGFFPLIYILRHEDVILEACKETSGFNDKIGLIDFISFLLNPVKVKSYVKCGHLKAKTIREDTTDVTESLLERFEEYNQKTYEKFVSFLIQFFKENNVVDDKLPITELKYTKRGKDKASHSELNEILKKHYYRKNYSLSSFAALGGNTEEYRDMKEIMKNKKQVISFDEEFVPIFPLDGTVTYSTYATELFKHGQVSKIYKEGIFTSRKLLTDALGDFVKAIRIMMSCLQLINSEKYKDLITFFEEYNKTVFAQIYPSRKYVRKFVFKKPKLTKEERRKMKKDRRLGIRPEEEEIDEGHQDLGTSLRSEIKWDEIESSMDGVWNH